MIRFISTKIALSCYSLLFILAAPQAIAHGEYHDVVGKLTPRIEAQPGNTKLRYQLTAAHVEHDEWELALAECDRIETIAPGKYQLGYFRGRSLATAGRWQEALAPLDQFIQSTSSHHEAHIWRARVHTNLNQLEKAALDYRIALEKSRNAEHHTEFAKTLVKQGHADQAVAALQNGLKLNPDDPAMLECMAECATTAKDHSAALAAIDRLIKTWPRPETWMLRRAKLLVAAGKSDDANAAWRALAQHLQNLPNLDRAQPFLVEIEAETNAVLGIRTSPPVVAPPANSGTK